MEQKGKSSFDFDFQYEYKLALDFGFVHHPLLLLSSLSLLCSLFCFPFFLQLFFLALVMHEGGHTSLCATVTRVLSCACCCVARCSCISLLLLTMDICTLPPNFPSVVCHQPAAFSTREIGGLGALPFLLVVVLLLSIPLAASLPLSLRRDRWASGFADVLTVGERDGALQFLCCHQL